MSHAVGLRYRVDHPGHAFDGKIGVLELVDGDTGYLMREGKTLRLPLESLRINGVLQNPPERLPQPEHFARLFQVLDRVNI